MIDMSHGDWFSQWSCSVRFTHVLTAVLSYCNCIVHHNRFCPVNFRLISCRALGSLDTSSGGTAVLLGDAFTGRDNRLPFILRWNVLDPSE